MTSIDDRDPHTHGFWVHGWVVSLLLHATGLYLALAMASSLRLAAQPEPFHWEVAVVTGTDGEPSSSAVAEPAKMQTVASPPRKPVSASPAPQPAESESAAVAAVSSTPPPPSVRPQADPIAPAPPSFTSPQRGEANPFRGAMSQVEVPKEIPKIGDLSLDQSAAKSHPLPEITPPRASERTSEEVQRLLNEITVPEARQMPPSQLSDAPDEPRAAHQHSLAEEYDRQVARELGQLREQVEQKRQEEVRSQTAAIKDLLDKTLESSPQSTEQVHQVPHPREDQPPPSPASAQPTELRAIAPASPGDAQLRTPLGESARASGSSDTSPNDTPDASAQARDSSTSTAAPTNPQFARAAVPRGSIGESNVQLKSSGKADYTWLAQDLLSTLEQLITYPVTARLNRWEGKVVVKVMVLESGEIESLKVVQSSGHPILDEDALQLLRRVSPLKLKQALGKPRVPLLVPVRYTLK